MLGEAVPGVVEGSQAWAAQVGPYKWPSKWVAGVITPYEWSYNPTSKWILVNTQTVLPG